MPAGRVDRYVRVPAARASAVMGPSLVEVTVMSANEDRYELRRVEHEVPGWAHGEATIALPSQAVVTWTELTRHAALERSMSSIAEGPCDTALGRTDCIVYSLRAGELSLTLYFAKNLPGPPVMVVKTICRELAELVVLVAHDGAGAGP